MKYKIFVDENNYLLGFEHTNTSADTMELDPSKMELDFLNCYHLIDSVLWLDEEKKANEIKKANEKEEEAKLEADKVKMLTDMMIVLREPSDKLGYDFEIYMLGNIELRREYVKAEGHSGTIDDPIPFELGLSLIPNAYYSYDGHLWVYMGQGGVVAEDYPIDDVNGWAFWE